MSRRWRAEPNPWTRLKPLAQEHRRNATVAEERLWQAMRGSKLSGFRFRRQHAVDRFIVDFYCREAALVIEVDGPIHDLTAVEDAARQAMLEGQNLTVPRFKNQEVLERLEGVLEVIQSHLPLSVDGEGAGGEVCASS